MADEMVIDGDESRDQIYTAVDMGDDGSGDEIYIVSIGASLVLPHGIRSSSFYTNTFLLSPVLLGGRSGRSRSGTRHGRHSISGQTTCTSGSK